MRILNLACSAYRPPEPFINIDILKSLFPERTKEREQIDAEPNYIEHDLTKGIPFEDNSCDGIFLSHFLEHLDVQQAVALVKECKRVLITGGVMVVSVPDTTYFKNVYPRDKNENWQELFGVTDVNNPIPTFMEAALFFEEHKQVLTEDSLWCILTMGGFDETEIPDSEVKQILKNSISDNRNQFSLIKWVVKK